MKSKLSGLKHIGARLRDARLAARLTQKQLGEMAGTDQTAIQKIESGRSDQPKHIMEMAAALDVNPAWLQFGEPYARRERPVGNTPAKVKASLALHIANRLVQVNQLLRQAENEKLAETAKLLALNLAYYQIRHGEVPLENFQHLMETEDLDNETARLVVTGMENLVSILGLVTAQDEAASGPTH